MTSEFGTTRCWLICTALVVALAGSSDAMASIALPDLPKFDLQAGCQSGAGACESKSDVPGDKAPQEDPPAIGERALPVGNSSTTTTTTSAGVVGPSPIASLSGTAASVPSVDPAVSRWACGEGRLVLPMPPGNDLLRPPQG